VVPGALRRPIRRRGVARGLAAGAVIVLVPPSRRVRRSPAVGPPGRRRRRSTVAAADRGSSGRSRPPARFVDRADVHQLRVGASHLANTASPARAFRNVSWLALAVARPCAHEDRASPTLGAPGSAVLRL
jgi:hypothetical protein